MRNSYWILLVYLCLYGFHIPSFYPMSDMVSQSTLLKARDVIVAVQSRIFVQSMTRSCKSYSFQIRLSFLTLAHAFNLANSITVRVDSNAICNDPNRLTVLTNPTQLIFPTRSPHLGLENEEFLLNLNSLSLLIWVPIFIRFGTGIAAAALPKTRTNNNGIGNNKIFW